MFIVQKNVDKTITWPVTVEVATDGGKVAKHTFNGTFKLLSDEQREALSASKLAGPVLDTPIEGAEIAWKEAAVDGILDVMTDWSGVVDETRTPIPFNRDTLLTAARSPAGIGLLRGINTAINEIATGARAKN